MTWRTVVLTKDSRLSLRLDHLVVTNDDIVTIPLSEIGQVVIDNPNIVLTGHLINALSKHKITTILCDNHLPCTHFNLVYGHFRQAKMIKTQIEWQDSRKDILWQEIIKKKIENQKSVLQYFNPDKAFYHFDNYRNQVELADETNREGHAAKVYFNTLFGIDFIRGVDTPINWALNYGYSLLLSLFTRVITTKGLLTEIGIHHRNQYNHYNLASDFMEVYRPLVDVIVKEQVVDVFTKEAKHELLDIFNRKVRIRQQKQYLTNSIELYVDSLIKYMRTGDKKDLRLPEIIYKK